MSAPVVGQQVSGKVMVRTNNKPEFGGEIFDNTPVEEVILATGGYDHTIKFWQAHTGKPGDWLISTIFYNLFYSRCLHPHYSPQ